MIDGEGRKRIGEVRVHVGGPPGGSTRHRR